MNEEYLVHHGIKGQKWGVRRFQNADGSLTKAGRNRYSDSGSQEKKSGLSDQTKRNIKIASAAALAIGTVAAATYYVSKHPETIKTVANLAKKKVSDISSNAVKAGKEYTVKAFKAGKEAAIEGVKAGYKQTIKTASQGVAIGLTYKALEQMFGRKQAEEAIDKYNAMNKKKKVAKDVITDKEDDYEEDDDD